MKRLLYLIVACSLLNAQERFAGSDALDRVVEEAIGAGQIPGAVLLVGQMGHNGQPARILHRKAYGMRSLVPGKEPMTIDTIFDIASISKLVGTTSSVLKLVEEGRVGLSDPVTKYLPQFQGGKSEITVRDLLTHFSGMRPDVDLKPEWSGYQTGIDLALRDKPVAGPGEKFIYSDINFILLGEIVRAVSGKPLNVYAKESIFVPLGMTETTYNPPAEWRGRIAPTEQVNGEVLRGVVHDETTRFMGGVAGHAGVFSTASDLSRWAQMILNLGQLNGARVLSPLTVQKATQPNSPPEQVILRGLGFDIDSPFSGNRGELFPIGSFGHTGFTGTSIWMDPSTRAFVILLANSVHPVRRPPITGLRGKVATIAAASLGLEAQGVSLVSYRATMSPRRAIARSVDTQTGLDVLDSEKFARLQGKRVGLITNHTGLTRDGRRNLDAMLAAGVKVTALFSPEHGLAGKEDHENVGHGKDEKTGIPIWSLYMGSDRKPSKAMLGEVDILVFDIQDIGARFYTYLCTMKNAMETAAQTRLPFVVLDRPNPITGVHVEGPVLEPQYASFVGCTEIPLRHGMTAGELARFMNEENKLGSDLSVVPMKNWRRGDWWDATGTPWVNPSPNMRNLTAALAYPGVALLEYSKNYSVGRGTDSPFLVVGSDWINGTQLATFLNRREVPGVRFYATRFRPESSYFAGQTIEGVSLVLNDRDRFSSFRLGLEIAFALETLYPGRIVFDANAKLAGSSVLLDAWKQKIDPRVTEQRVQEGLKPFLEKRQKYLLYE